MEGTLATARGTDPALHQIREVNFLRALSCRYSQSASGAASYME
jgi:hypothetical protein